MRWFLGLLLVCGVLLFFRHDGHAHDDGCSATTEIQVNVHPVFADPAYDFSYGIGEIQHMADKDAHTVREGWALGLTSYQPVLNMTAPVTAHRAADGTFCARPASVNINFGYKDMTVAIPNELPGESCGLAQILHHEDEHVDVSRRVLQKYIQLLHDRLQSEIRSNMNTRQPTAEGAIALEQNMLNATLIDIAAQISAETTALQQDVDSPEEYHRMLSICDGELDDLVKKTREAKAVAQQF